MTGRIILAGILGGIVMFIWTSIAHMFLPLGEAGIHELTNEQTALAALQVSLGENSGLYIFPGKGAGENPTRQQENEAMKHYGEKLAANPSGILMYYPAGARPLSMGKLLTIEFATELLEAVLAVFLLAQTRIVSFGGRVGFVFVIGIVAAIATNISYWNWYGFPAVYTAAYMSIQIIGFLCIGLVAALVLAKSSPAPA
ncbi:MAG TPA: hypothetical protein VGI42_05160 [Chthoniobacterales bacterium]|jgi:hypothetical protein